jgi:uncharacterized protein (AIM24 family)
MKLFASRNEELSDNFSNSNNNSNNNQMDGRDPLLSTENPMSFNTICDHFCNEQKPKEESKWSMASERILRVVLKQGESIFMKHSTMVFYEGNIDFTRKSQGLGKLIKTSLVGEGLGTTEAKAISNSVLHLAHDSKKIVCLYLQNGESIVVAHAHLHVLAFEPSVTYDVVASSGGSFFASGFFALKFTGPGYIAIGCHFDPLVLHVRPNVPVFTSPHHTVLWSASLQPSFHSNLKLKALFGRSSGEEFQMKFEGNGYIFVQSFNVMKELIQERSRNSAQLSNF